jgi:hypothetical protein
MFVWTNMGAVHSGGVSVPSAVHAGSVSTFAHA